MTHPTGEQLNELIDGRLDETAEVQVSDHLKQCRSCSASYRMLKLIDAGIRRQTVERPGAQFVDALMNKALSPAPASPHPKTNRLLKFGANILALLLVAGMAYGIFGLASLYLPKDSAAVKQIGEFAGVQSEAAGWWNHAWGNVRSLISSAAPDRGLPLWLPGIWSVVLVFLVDRLIAKRFRRPAP